MLYTDKWSKKVVALHFSDNLGKLDDHWLPGLGTIKWDSLLSALADSKDTNTIMLEVFPQKSGIDVETSFLNQAYKIACNLRDSIKSNQCIN